MNIKKMLLLAGMALAAIAFAAPAAQAEVALTENGEPLLAGDPVTAVSTNLERTLGSNVLTCSTVVLHYEVEENEGIHLVLQPTAAHNATFEGCTLHTPVGTFPFTTTNAGAGELTINTWGTGVTALTYTVFVPALGLHCTVTGNLPLQASHTNNNILNVETGNVLHGTPKPPCGDSEAHGSFAMRTPDGTPLQLDFVTTT